MHLCEILCVQPGVRTNEGVDAYGGTITAAVVTRILGTVLGGRHTWHIFLVRA